MVHGDGARQAMDEGLGGVVQGHRGIGVQAGNRAQVDDAAAACPHARQYRATHVESAPGIDAHEQIPVLVGRVDQGLLDLHARVVDQDRRHAEAFEGSLQNARGVLRPGDIGLEPHDLTAKIVRASTTTAGHHSRTLAEELLDYCAADSPATACHNHNVFSHTRYP
ncbi:hypothetical protein D3C78_1234540 [compost metagenome]